MRGNIRSGIPTTYAGVRFRSRLEAAWAAFFDELEWPWQHEALDLDLYVPDFVLPFRGAPLLVEVKPELYEAELAQHCGKIERSGWEEEAIIVGTTPCLAGDRADMSPLFGLLAERDESSWRWGAGILHACLHCTQWSLHHETGSWHCRANGCYDGNAYLGHVARPDVLTMWRRAYNRVRYQHQRPTEPTPEEVFR